MAKSTALARFGARPLVINMPRARSVGRRVVHVVRRAGRSRAGRAIARALPTTGIIMGGATVGYMQSRGFFDKLPTVMGSRMVTLGIAGWAATRYIRSPNIRLAGFAALAAAAFDWGRVQGGGASGWDEY